MDAESDAGPGVDTAHVTRPAAAVTEPMAVPSVGGEPARRPWRLSPPALHVRTFRWYWVAQWPVLLGTWMQVVALGYLVFSTTHSQTAVSVVAAANGLPAVALSLVGGALADRVPRRRLLLVTQSVLGLSSAALAVLVASGHATLPAIIVVAAIFGSATAVDLPALQALVADLVDREMVVSAMALAGLTMSATRIVGPSVAGLLIATAGSQACFGFLALAYLAPIAVLFVVIPDISPPPRRSGSSALGDIRQGLATAARDPLVRSITICAAALSLLGVSYMPFLPVFAREQLQADSVVLGVLYSTGGIGGVVAGLILASLGHGGQRVRMLFGGGVVYAVSLFTLAHSHHLAVALPALVGISFGFLAMNTSMTTLLQTETETAMRGRLLGIYVMIFAGLQPLGTLLYGVVGRVVPLFDAIGVGALVVGASALWAATRPALRSVGEVR